MLDDFSRHQQGIIKRFYKNFDSIQSQRLAELVGELYLAEGKKKEKLWQSAATVMQKLEVPQARIDHLLAKKDVVLLAGLVKEMTAG